MPFSPRPPGNSIFEQIEVTTDSSKEGTPFDVVRTLSKRVLERTCYRNCDLVGQFWGESACKGSLRIGWSQKVGPIL